MRYRGTHYEGNYCPRCGQSAKIGRYSFKNAFLLFLDVWGIGNRGMFRSIRDLILRPGYMIRDYLRGMQMAYFPPFKMFFLLLALWLVVDSGLNIQFVNRDELNEEETEQLFSQFKPIVTLSEDKNAAEKRLVSRSPKRKRSRGSNKNISENQVKSVSGFNSTVRCWCSLACCSSPCRSICCSAIVLPYPTCAFRSASWRWFISPI